MEKDRETKTHTNVIKYINWYWWQGVWKQITLYTWWVKYFSISDLRKPAGTLGLANTSINIARPQRYKKHQQN